MKKNIEGKVVVITGASSAEQIAANARVASWKLGAAEAAEVRAILENKGQT